MPLFPSPRPAPITQRNDLAPPFPHMRRDSPTLLLLLTTTNHSQPPSKISPPEVSIRKPSTLNFKKKTHTCSLNSAGYLKSLQYLSLTGHRSYYLRDLPPNTHLPFGTQSRPLTPTTHRCKRCLRCFSFTSLHSSCMTLDAKMTTIPTPLLTDLPSTSDYGKLKLDFGYHSSMIYFKPTLNSTN